MEFIIKLAAIMFGSHLLEEPKVCDCRSTQSVIIEQSASISIIDYNKAKCLLSGDIDIDIVPDDVSARFTISMWSGRELINKQTLMGKSTTRISSKVIVKKQKVWIQIETESPGEHLASISFNSR